MNLERLHNVLSVQSVTYKTEDMQRYLRRQFAQIGATWTEDAGNLYATKGHAALYPCIVAHTDTVHRLIPTADYRVLRIGDNYHGWNAKAGTPAGVGGDDKTGIFIALEMLRALPAAKAAFFRDEETGCQGSAAADMTFFHDCSFVLQADRKGSEDFVSNACGTELHGPQFAAAAAPIIARWNYKPFEHGGLTDVCTLKEDGRLAVAAVNISAAYFRPHGADEYVSISHLRRALGMTEELCRELGQQTWTHEAPAYTSILGTFRGGWYTDDDYTYSKRGQTWTNVARSGKASQTNFAKAMKASATVQRADDRKDAEIWLAFYDQTLLEINANVPPTETQKAEAARISTDRFKDWARDQNAARDAAIEDGAFRDLDVCAQCGIELDASNSDPDGDYCHDCLDEADEAQHAAREQLPALTAGQSMANALGHMAEAVNPHIDTDERDRVQKLWDQAKAEAKADGSLKAETLSAITAAVAAANINRARRDASAYPNRKRTNLTVEDPCPNCGKCQLDYDGVTLFCWQCQETVPAADVAADPFPDLDAPPARGPVRPRLKMRTA